MKHTIAEINDTRTSVAVTVEPSEITELRKGIISSFIKEAKIPGFRQGKAPAAMIEKKYGKAVADELNNKVLSKAYDYVHKTTELDIYGVADINGSIEDASVENTFTFTLDLNPKFELPEYQGIAISVTKPVVEDSEVQKVIDQVLNQRADYKEVERAAAKGDYVKLGYEGTIDGQSMEEILPNKPMYTKQATTWEEAGAEDGPGVPAIVEGLVGMQAGDKKEVTMEFPAGFEEAELAGKTAVYALEVMEVREKILPAIDEEFLKSLKMDSEEALRTEIANDLKNRKEHETNTSKREQIINFLEKETVITVPQLAKENESRNLLQDFIESQSRKGVTQEQLEEHKDQLIEQADASAEKEAKLLFILSRISETEKVEPTQEDMSRILMSEAMMAQVKPDQLVKELQKDKSKVQRLRYKAMVNKTLDFLVEKANLSYTEEANS